MGSFQTGVFQNNRIGAGYAYTFVVRNAYLGLLLGTSLGLQQQKFDLVDEKFDRWVTSVGANAKIGIGYNGKRFFSGLQFIMDNTAIAINDYTIGLNTGEIKLFIGSRFEDIKLGPINDFGNWLYGE